MLNINPDAAPASPAVTKKSCHFCGFERGNADLLNAAPELLAACRMFAAIEIVDLYGNPLPESDDPEWADIMAARRAVAKAEGRA